MNLKKIGKILTSKSVGTGPSSYEKRIYRAAVSQRLRNTDVYDRLISVCVFLSSPFIIIPPMLHTNLHLNVIRMRRTSGRKFSVIVEHWKKFVLTHCRLRSSKVKQYARTCL